MRLSQRETAALIHLLHTGTNNIIDGLISHRFISFTHSLINLSHRKRIKYKNKYVSFLKRLEIADGATARQR